MNAGYSPSPYAREAARLLGAQIAQGRRARRWSAAELAQRIGVSRRTVAKIEQGDPGVRLGTAFEAARLVGVPLFREERSELRAELDRAHDRLALLPQRVRARGGELDDDF